MPGRNAWTICKNSTQHMSEREKERVFQRYPLPSTNVDSAPRPIVTDLLSTAARFLAVIAATTQRLVDHNKF